MRQISQFTILTGHNLEEADNDRRGRVDHVLRAQRGNDEEGEEEGERGACEIDYCRLR